MLPAQPDRLEHPPAALRAWRDTDARLIASVASDPLIPLITSVPTSGQPSDIASYLERQRSRSASGQGYSFAIADVHTDEAVGNIGLWTRDLDRGRASIGYWIAAPHRHHGYAAAALQALTRWAVTLGDLARLELFVEPWNEASWRIAEGCGFMREGLLRRWQKVGSERRDMWVYSLIPDRDDD